MIKPRAFLGAKPMPELSAIRVATPREERRGAASDTVVRALERIRAYEAEYGRGELGGYTFATWREVQDASIDSEQLLTSDWRFIFELARTLGRYWGIPDHQIRFVVWYNW